jgi:hypothetical protein
MQQQQVQLLDAKLRHTFFERMQGRFVAVVADPDFGLDEHLITSETGATNPLADLTLVQICSGCIDVTIANAQGLGDRRARAFRRRLEHAESDDRHLDPIVQFHCAATDHRFAHANVTILWTCADYRPHFTSPLDALIGMQPLAELINAE